MLLDELDDLSASVELEELETVALLVLLLDELDDEELSVELEDELLGLEDEELDGVALLLLEELEASISSPATQTRMSTPVVALVFVMVITSDAPPTTA